MAMKIKNGDLLDHLTV